MRVLEIDGGTVHLASLVIERGAAASGVESWITAAPTIRDSRLTANVAYGNATTMSQGGAIAQEGGTTTLVRDILTGNRGGGESSKPRHLPAAELTARRRYRARGPCRLRARCRPHPQPDRLRR